MRAAWAFQEKLPIPYFKRVSEVNGTTGGPDLAETYMPGFSDPENLVEIEISGKKLWALLDTGADRSVMTARLWKECGSQHHKRKEAPTLRSATMAPIATLGLFPIEIRVGATRLTQEFVICEELNYDVILGMDFLQASASRIDCGKRQVYFGGEAEPVPLRKRTEVQNADVVLQTETVIPARTALFCPGTCNVTPQGGRIGLITPMRSHLPEGVLLANAVVETEDNKVWMHVINTTEVQQRLTAGQVLAIYEPVDDVADWEEQPARQCGLTNVEAAVQQIRQGTLTTEEKGRVAALLYEFADVFVEDGKPLGRTTLFYHRIDTGAQPPVKIRGRRIPPFQRKEVNDMLDDMLRNKIIRPSNSPWSSPILLVRKKDGTLRCCVDFRRLNEITIKDAYPLPRIDESLDALSGSKYFTVIDLKSGYWQLPLEEISKEKTAFSTHRGLFEFNVLPMGITNGPAAFARLMNNVLAGLTWDVCLVYLDDTIVVGRTFDEHITNLERVLQRFRKANLQLNPKKCQWFQREVQYLGHRVSSTGVHTEPSTVEKVQTWPRPENQKQLRSFIGLCSYYRRFVKNFAQIAEPLHRLTGKHAKFTWTPECEAAFITLRQSLCQAPVLALPDFSAEAGVFILDTDASDTAIGCVLSQKGQDGLERVIAYGSRCLNRAERNYCVTRREMLAMVYFIQELRPYLLGRPFLLRTDHSALTWLQTFKEPTGQIARWIQKLQEYQFTTEYRPNPKHRNADALSRRPTRNHGDCPTCKNETAEETISTITWPYGWTAEDLRRAQLAFPATAHVVAWIHQERPRPPQLTAPQAVPELPTLMREYGNCALIDDILHLRLPDDPQWRVILPPSWREQALRQYHDNPIGGHTGKESTYRKVSMRFWWPKLKQTVDKWVDSCGVCGELRGPIPSTTAPLQPIEPGEPLQRVALDIIGPLPPTKQGHRFILTMVDPFSKWAEAIPLRTHTARSVATALLQHWAARYGVPKEILTDQGKEFESTLFQHLCTLLGMQKLRSSPYHPMGNGAIERLNRTLKNLLLSHTDRERERWDETLPFCLWAYRANIHHSTGYSPARLLRGREMRFPIDVLLESTACPHIEAEDYADWVQASVRIAAQTARDNLAAARAHQKKYYDRSATSVPHYQAGDLIWVQNTTVPPGSSPKLIRPWEGPYLVSRVLSRTNVEITNPARPGRTTVVHVNRIKPCPIDIRLDPNDHARTRPERTPVTEHNSSGTVPDIGAEVELTPMGGPTLSSLQECMEVESPPAPPPRTSATPGPGPLPDSLKEEWVRQLSLHLVHGAEMNLYLTVRNPSAQEWLTAVTDEAVQAAIRFVQNRATSRNPARRPSQARLDELMVRFDGWLQTHPYLNGARALPWRKRLAGAVRQLDRQPPTSTPSRPTITTQRDSGLPNEAALVASVTQSVIAALREERLLPPRTTPMDARTPPPSRSQRPRRRPGPNERARRRSDAARAANPARTNERAEAPTRSILRNRRPSSYAEAARRPTRSPDRPTSADRESPNDTPILVVGDSNFTRGPFTRAPFASVARGGLRTAEAARVARTVALRPERVGAVIVGVGVNDTRSQSAATLRGCYEQLHDTLRELYPNVPLYHVEAPARKRRGAERRAVEEANRAAAGVFRQIRFRARNTGTGDPHYTPREREDLAREVLGVIRREVPRLRNLRMPRRE